MRPLGRANLRDSAVLGASGRALGSTRQELRAAASSTYSPIPALHPPVHRKPEAENPTSEAV